MDTQQSDAARVQPLVMPAPVAELPPIEVIRMQHCLRSWENVTSKLPEWWVAKLRLLFEQPFEPSQLVRCVNGEITEGNGYFGFIEPGAYRNGDTERRWQSFLRGAIAQRLISNSVFIDA